MKIQFDCPSCGAPCAADPVYAGLEANCVQCGYHFTIPKPGESFDEAYELKDPGPPQGLDPGAGSVFVPARGEEPAAPSTFRASPGAPARPAGAPRKAARKSKTPRGAGLLWAGVAAALASAAVALLAPRGTVIVGSVLIGLGSVLVLVGYGAGAFGAFSEDVVYGLLYLLVPLYTAYYLVSRWEDLWPWFACSTAGVGLVLLGTELLRWAGAGA